MENLIYSLEGKDFIPLCDLLKRVGFCETGGVAKGVISEGQVLVDGKVELRKRYKTRPGQIVELDGNKVTVKV
jgi:ribosome-associated protein